MAKELMAISDGVYVFSETEIENQFCFFRNDRKVLTGNDKSVNDFYHEYIMYKMINDPNINISKNILAKEVSDDGRCINITCHEIDESFTFIQKKPNFMKRLLEKFKH